LETTVAVVAAARAGQCRERDEDEGAEAMHAARVDRARYNRAKPR
jgi:hypothetical protein